MSKWSYVSTPTSVAVRFPSGEFKQLLKEHPLFSRLIEALKSFKYDVVPEIFDRAALIKRHTRGQFWINEGGLIVHKGETMPEGLSRRILAFCEQDIDTSSLVKFWENLCQNPSIESKKHLYGFMEHNDIPITEDGCFVAYKYVRNDWKDCHTGTIDNSIDQTPKMNREDVDPDPRQTCSRGLHVCSFKYLGNCGGNNRHIEVKVNPINVVAVPFDYDGQKMRTCEYTVLREVEKGPRFEQLYPKFKEGQRVEVSLEDGTVEVGTVDEILTSPTEQNSYLVTLDNGNRPTVKENKIVLFDLNDSDENTDDDDFEDDDDFDVDDYEDDEIDEDDEDVVDDSESRISKLEEGQKRIEDKLDKGLRDIKKAIDEQ